MAESRDEADRFAAGTGNTDAGREDEDMMPGVTAGGATYLPETGRAAAGGGADRAEGTIGAVGPFCVESLFTPAGSFRQQLLRPARRRST